MAARRKELDNLADIATPAEVQQLQKIAAWLNYESQIAQMYSRVVLLDNSYYISGFVPQDSVQALRDAVKNTLRRCACARTTSWARPPRPPRSCTRRQSSRTTGCCARSRCS